MDAALLERIARGTTTASDAATLRDRMFILAHQITSAAAILDSANAAQILQPIEIGRSHVENLYDIAEELAMDRAQELYAPEDGVPHCEVA